MYISVEISYYPLLESFDIPVHEFLAGLKENKNIEIEIGKMSSLITGEYNEVMSLLQKNIKKVMENYPSIFTIKLSNTCLV